jgi:mediator of RNA polymerase II transcription subunit 5
LERLAQVAACTSHIMGPSAEQWKKLLQHCFTHRTDVNDFRDLAKFLFRRCPLPEQALLDVIFDCRAATNVQWDPLVPLYIHALFELGMVKISEVLDSLLKHSSVVESQQGKAITPDKRPRKPSTFMSDTRILQDTCLIISSGNLPRSVGEAILIFTSTAEWISAVATLHTASVNEDQQAGGLVSSPDTISLFETLGILIATVSGTEKGLEALSSEKPEGNLERC